MTKIFTSFLLIGTETDASLKEKSTLSQSNYVKFPGSLHSLRSITQVEKSRYDPQHDVSLVFEPESMMSVEEEEIKKIF